MKRQRALAIAPTYNEAENIGTLIDGLMKQPGQVEVLVVDDASCDGTADIVRECAERYPGRVHLLERAGKLGLGTAYLAGFRYALGHGYDLAISMDADLSHDPRHLREILHMAKIADVVVGSRYIAGGAIKNWGPHRHLLSGGANMLARAILGLNARDCTSGYRCYRRRMLERLDLAAIESDGYSCLLELLTVCQRRGARIREIPIVFVDRRAGQSKISSAEIGKAFLTLWRLGRRLNRRKS
ncbi:polyprenol monophosphomannose synthase [Candidatus Poribacteria bacterium]|nr:polyprenol monophosphomannose synthase [Candidatus Poribacteria bacterium]